MQIHPLATKLYIELNPPSLSDNTADLDRLRRGLRRTYGIEDFSVGLGRVADYSRILRESGWCVTALLGHFDEGWRMLDLEPGRTDHQQLGLAVDLGTTTIVARLVEMGSGRTLGESSLTNPQVRIGPDILTRIHAARGPGLAELQALAVEGIDRATRSVCAQADCHPNQVLGLSVAGNTTMTHLLLGLDPSRIYKEPYIPVINRPGIVRAEELGLGIHPQGPVFTFPNVGSYFGGDLIAGLIATGLGRAEEVGILVDVGTNAEVVVGNREWLMACAGAAGPALEGGVAKMGMAAGPGAIERVRIDPLTLTPEIGLIESPENPTGPLGLCGSGLIDLVAELFLAGVIDPQGRIRPLNHDRLVRTEDGWAFVVHDHGPHQEPILFSQIDLDILLRSKAAMYTILSTLVSQVGLAFEDLTVFHVAGTFGQHIDPHQAIIIGMIPDLPMERYQSAGNSSLAGATAALLSQAERDLAREIRDRITYLELNVNQEFMNNFSAAKFLPHTDRDRFPSVPAQAARPETPID